MFSLSGKKGNILHKTKGTYDQSNGLGDAERYAKH